ncbi:MAG: hypothetical protein ACSNEK_00905 [Parachlamydiaceae bacterium]
MAVPIVKESIQALTPGYHSITKLALIPAEFFMKTSLVVRKIRLFRKPQNLAPLLAGNILDVLAGDRPTVRMVARIILGSASILRCTEDLLQIVEQANRIKKILRGRSFVVIKKKTWQDLNPSITHSPSHIYFAKMAQAQDPILAQRLLQCFWEMMKRLGSFILHFADACTAFRDNHSVSEIFVHSRDILDKVSSDDAVLVKNLKQLQRVTDMILSKIGASWTTTALIGLLRLPNAVRRKLPPIEDLMENSKYNLGLIKEKAAAANECLGFLSPKSEPSTNSSSETPRIDWTTLEQKRFIKGSIMKEGKNEKRKPMHAV